MFTYEMFYPLLKPVFTVLLLLAILIALRLLFYYRKFKQSKYSVVSGNNFVKTVFEKGNNGEFLTFSLLEKLEGRNKLLTNLYIPKGDGTTTEIDLLMISPTGIYVFESKNYSGWIFGDEKNKNWTQSHKGGKKFKFFNPVWQNKSHIEAARKLSRELHDTSMFSYIVFSERCELKKVSIATPGVKVVKRNHLLGLLKKDMKLNPSVLSEADISTIHETLLKYGLANEAVKQNHIQRINGKNGNEN